MILVKSIVFCLVLLFGCFFENQSFGMNRSSDLMLEKSKNKNASNSHNRYQCNDCEVSLSREWNYRAHIMRVHAFCIWCESYPIGKQESQWYSRTSYLEREYLYNHLIECARRVDGNLYICKICFGFYYTNKKVHFFTNCSGKSEKVLSGKKEIKQPVYDEKFENCCGVLGKNSVGVQSHPENCQDTSKNIDFSNLVMTSHYQISLEDFFAIINNDRVEQQYDYLDNPDYTYASILHTSVCASFFSQISTQSCDVTLS